VCRLTDLAGRVGLSALVGVGSNLGEEYNEQHSQGEGQPPGPVPYGFSPSSRSTSHFTPAFNSTRSPRQSKQCDNPA
jgi:hypothetical protein